MRLPGQYADVETGLHYNLNRFYDPQIGRYITRDPIGINGGANQYVYANGTPLLLTDPLGLFGAADLPTFPDWFVNGAAGMGDVLTFGLTKQGRRLLKIESVDECSRAYAVGEVVGIVGSVATGFVGGTKAVARASSGAANFSNFSHTLLPNAVLKKFDNGFARWLNRSGNRLNGDHLPVSRDFDLHARIDMVARRGLDPDWLARNPPFSPIRQAWNRVPYTPGAAIYGGASYALNRVCGC